MNRTEVQELCRRLGFDPGAVTEIVIESDRVTVTYLYGDTGKLAVHQIPVENATEVPR